MEEESIRKTGGSDVRNPRKEPAKEEGPEKHPNDRRGGVQKSVGWPVWLLVILMGLLFASSIANLVVSQRAYEGSRKQVQAIEQLTQSIRAVQQSIGDLSRMIEQSAPEDQEPEEDRGGAPTGDGSI